MVHLRKYLTDPIIKVNSILTAALGLTQFPFFCGALVGGYTLLQAPLRVLLKVKPGWLASRGWWTVSCTGVVLPRFIAAFVASWLSLKLLNKTGRQPSRAHLPIGNESAGPGSFANGGLSASTPEITLQRGLSSKTLAGSTIDLTLLVTIRALDIIIGDLWKRRKAYRKLRGKWTPLESSISRLTDAGVFAVSSGFIMWSWFYFPERLPRAYNKWIGEAAQVDHRLVEALRKARRGDFVYGRNTGQTEVLQSMCKDYGWPLSWGDPAQTIPIPCEMVHMGEGPSCHRHAVVRFIRAFKFALVMYLPLQLLVKARNPSLKSLKQACRDALRSSAFLGAFISLFYYSVCLSRTTLGPRIFSRNTITPMVWDQGLCVQAGCMMCGWSILVEAEKRRQEIALFVAPRAAATLLPRRYEQKVCRPSDLMLGAQD